MPEIKKPRHEAFCQEYYTNGFNGSQAYIKVYGKSGQTAEVNSSKLLRNTKIAARLAELSKGYQKKYEYTVEKLVEELNEIEELAKQPIHGSNNNNYDLTNWIKSKQEKAKLFGLYAPTITKQETQLLDKNGQPTDPICKIPEELMPKPKDE